MLFRSAMGWEEKQKETVEKIGSIKEHLAHTATEQLMEFVQAYESDSRAGVQKLVETARKRFDKLQLEKIRTENLKKYEKEYDNYTYICGIDEVGRGPLAGPVVAAAVILPKDCDILYINDSKKLSAAKREELYDVIMEKAVSVGIGMVGPERIDEINILQATYEAMRQAIGQLFCRQLFRIRLNCAVNNISSPASYDCACGRNGSRNQHVDVAFSRSRR